MDEPDVNRSWTSPCFAKARPRGWLGLAGFALWAGTALMTCSGDHQSGGTGGKLGTFAGNGGSDQGGAGGAVHGSGGASSASGGFGGGAASPSCPGSTEFASSHCDAAETPALYDCNLSFCGNKLHRLADNACPEPAPNDTSLPATGLGDQCQRGSDCTAQRFGFCFNDSAGGGQSGNVCGYGCRQDRDCGAQQVCRCGGEGSCMAAQCATDADCGPSKLCVQVPIGCGRTSYTYMFACETDRDTCGGGVACGFDEACLFNGDHMACAPACHIT